MSPKAQTWQNVRLHRFKVHSAFNSFLRTYCTSCSHVCSTHISCICISYFSKNTHLNSHIRSVDTESKKHRQTRSSEINAIDGFKRLIRLQRSPLQSQTDGESAEEVVLQWLAPESGGFRKSELLHPRIVSDI